MYKKEVRFKKVGRKVYKGGYFSRNLFQYHEETDTLSIHQHSPGHWRQWCLLVLAIVMCSPLLGQVRMERLSVLVNSPFAERQPIITPDGQTLFFARKWHPHNIGEENQDDIWVSYRQADGSWSRAVNMGMPLNNRNHNFVVAVSPSGNTLYLGNHYRGNAKDGISIAHKQGRSWSRPKAMPIEDFYNKNDFVSYHVSVDERVLMMAVEREEGFGDRDLYVSFREAGDRWSRPLHLGATLNTPGIESSVFLAADNKTIYFSSNGHGGMGGLDMFLSRRLDESWTNWSEPINLGKGINTPQNEYSYTIPANGEYAYFASDNENGMSDLFRIPLPADLRPEPVTIIHGRLVNAASGNTVEGNIRVDRQDQAWELNTADNGHFQIVVPHRFQCWLKH